MKENILNNRRVRNRLTSYMRTILFDHDEYLAQNKLLKKEIEKVTLRVNEGDSCYTNSKTIVLGSNFTTFLTGSDDQIFKKAQGVTAHEVAHILYTDFEVTSTFFNTASQKYKKLAQAAKQIFNIIEDYRIEEKISNINSYYKKLFLMNRYEIVKNAMESLNERKPNEFSSDDVRATFFLNSLLIMGFTKAKFVSKDPKTDKLISKAFPFIYEAINAESTEEALELTNQIMLLIQDLDIPEGTESNVSLDAEIEKFLGKLTPKGSKSPLNPGSSNDNKSGESGKGEPTPTSFGQEGPLPSKESKSYGEQDINANMEEADKIEQQSAQEIFDQMEEEIIDDLESINENHLTTAIIEGYLSQNQKEKNKKTKEQAEKKIIDILDRNVMPEIHKGVKLNIRRDKAKFSAIEYDDIKKLLAYDIKKVVKELQSIEERKKVEYDLYQESGLIDENSLVRFISFGDDNIFKTPLQNEEQFDMEVTVLVDCSGSNSSLLKGTNIPRFLMNQKVAIFLHEIFKEMEFRHTIWGFDTGAGENLSQMIDRDNCFSKEAGLSLADISARGCNRDGYYIRLAGENLLNYSESNKKLLIVISDGQPSAPGYAGGDAMKDIIDVQKYLKESGIKTIGIFTGDESENKYFEDMYENRFFLNNETLQEYPKVFREILAKEFAEELE